MNYTEILKVLHPAFRQGFVKGASVVQGLEKSSAWYNDPKIMAPLIGAGVGGAGGGLGSYAMGADPETIALMSLLGAGGGGAAGYGISKLMGGRGGAKPSTGAEDDLAAVKKRFGVVPGHEQSFNPENVSYNAEQNDLARNQAIERNLLNPEELSMVDNLYDENSQRQKDLALRMKINDEMNSANFRKELNRNTNQKGHILDYMFDKYTGPGNI